MASRTIDPIAKLRQFVGGYATQREAAMALGIAPSYLTDLLYGRRLFSARILDRLGLVTIVVADPSRAGAVRR